MASLTATSMRVSRRHAGEADFLVARFGEEAGGDVVGAGAGDALQAADGDVVVGQEQSIGGDEGSRGADAHSCEAQVIRPGF